MEHSFVLATKGGVEDVTEPAGSITLVLDEGSTIADLEVADGAGHRAIVHLDYRMLADLMIHAGRVASEL